MKSTNVSKSPNRIPRHSLYLYNVVGQCKAGRERVPCIHIEGKNLVDYHIIHQQVLSTFIQPGKITLTLSLKLDSCTPHFMDYVNLRNQHQLIPDIRLIHAQLRENGFTTGTPYTVRVEHERICIYTSDLADQMPPAIGNIEKEINPFTEFRQVTVSEQENKGKSKSRLPAIRFGG